MFTNKMRVHNVVIVLLYITNLSTKVVGKSNTKGEPNFRILAPEFICPKDENTIVEKPDNTVITLQTTSNADLRFEWIVRWSMLTPAPRQRFTILVWQTVRQLEKQLNMPPPEPYVYVIENSELLPGVNYTFDVVSIDPSGHISSPRGFHIDNTQGDQKLMMDGRSDMMSVLLVGPQVAYVDDGFVVEAVITTCQPTQEYYFAWTVQSSNDSVDVSLIQGSRLEVPTCKLRVGFIYNVICQVMRYNTKDLITQTNLPFHVQYRGLEVYLNVDYLQISQDVPFTINIMVVSHDYCKNAPMRIDWECKHRGEPCDAIIVMEDEIMYFPSGLANVGEYYITVSVKILNETAYANATLVVVRPILPVIQINPVARILNKGEIVSVVANVTMLVPSCTLSWYFVSEEYLANSYLVINNDTCDDCEHGKALSDTVIINSLEEQFLNELTDFSNDTEWRQVTATFTADAGRARFVAQCGCSLTYNCETQGSVYTDVWFQLNEKPTVKDVLVTPETGTALETVFRLSTHAAVSEAAPLQYSFYCRAGNDTILLGSYVEHRAMETFLPYNSDGLQVWTKVCDVRGACSRSHTKVVTLNPGVGRTLNALIFDVAAHARRCEMVQLVRVVQIAIITYTNAHQPEHLNEFSQSLKDSISRLDLNNCVKIYKQYNKIHSELLLWLMSYGLEIRDIS